MSEIKVMIGGHTYRVSAGEGGEARMADLAAELDGMVNALKERLGPIGDRSLAVVAALTILDRFAALRSEKNALAAKLAQTERAREDAMVALQTEDPELLAALAGAAERVETLAAALQADLKVLATGKERRVPIPTDG